ncbi:conserved hypothetical protein [Trichinella spiralis]|uniref:hypothetical protein n=1 Tax=Trichinella spiralis TaxID=6334 RepID=UPI0001EFE5A2|nr:conserved hypothetical protein [Trichinella spiralis]
MDAPFGRLFNLHHLNESNFDGAINSMKTSENNKQNTKAVTRKEIAISGTAVSIQMGKLLESKNVPWKYYAILKFLQIFAGLIWRAVHYTSRNLYTKAGHVDCPNS